MRPISDRFRAALGVSHDRVTRIDCTVPGGEPVAIDESNRDASGRYGAGWTAATVSSSKSTGVRYSANLSIVAQSGSDTYGMVSTPGAVFTVRHGINFGAGDVELVDCGVYEAASGGVRIGNGGVSLSLVDMWQRVDRAKFLAPFSPATSSRGLLIATAVANAVPATTVYVAADGGTYEEGEKLWDRDRTTYISDLAKDGSLDVGFDASGNFRIRREPILDPASSVWTFRTGDAGNIESADRQRPFGKWFNMVIVQPLDSSQSWDQQVAYISDPTNPLHRDRVGGDFSVVYKSATANSESEAAEVAATILRRASGATETVSIDAFGNPALEVGDVVTIAHEATDTDPGFAAFHIIDSFQMDLRTGSMSLATRSSALPELEVS